MEEFYRIKAIGLECDNIEGTWTKLRRKETLGISQSGYAWVILIRS